MFDNKLHRFILSIFLILLIAGYIAGLFIDVTRDAGKYATIAKETFQHGNYINLTLNGIPYEQKPPLLFWLGALGYTIGGISNFWFKFPVLLLVFLGFYWSYGLAKSLYDRRVGIITVLLQLSSFIYVLYTMDVHTDTLLQVFVTLALWQLYEFIKTGKNKYYITGFIAIGFAMLSKGPVGAIIPAFAVVGHILLKRDFTKLLDYRWYLGILISFIIASPALIGLMNQFGWEGMRFFFWENIAGRVTGLYVQTRNHPFFFVHNLVYQILPWTLLFFISTCFEFRQLISNRFKSDEYFTLTGIWIYFIIINTSKSQLPNYVFSIIPLMLILTSKWIIFAIDKMSRLRNLFFWIQNSVVALLWIGIFSLSLVLFPVQKASLWVIFAVGIGSTLLIFIKFKEPIIKVLTPSIIVFTCLVLLMNVHVFPYIFSFQAPPQAARYYTENRSENDKLYDFSNQYEIFFYSEPQAIPVNSENELKKIVMEKGNWIFTDEKGLKAITNLSTGIDTIIHYRHLFLDSGGKFINPGNRDKSLHPMYLIRF